MPAFPAVMAVPETAMDEDNCAIAREHDVWFTGKVPPVQPEAEPFAKEQGTDKFLRAGVAAFDRGHHAGPDLFRDFINHLSV